MRNCPRYSRGSLDAEEITRPRRKKIFFSTLLFVMTSVPVFCPRLSHWRRSPGSIVWRFPERPMTSKGARLYLRSLRHSGAKKNGGPKAAVRWNAAGDGDQCTERRRAFETTTVSMAVAVLPDASVVWT